MSKTLGEILESNGNFKELTIILGDRKPLSFEYDKLKRTLTDFVWWKIGSEWKQVG